MNIRTRKSLGVFAALLVVGVGLFLWHIGSPRIVARAVTPEGIEMCIVQRCNWSGEPFTTSFVFRKPGGRWGWFYYDHQDTYWGSGHALINTNTALAVFYRRGAPAVSFDWAAETYTLHRWNRTDTAPEWMPAGWSPQVSIR